MTNYIQSEVVDLLNLDKKKLSKYDKLWGQLCSQNQDNNELLSIIERTSPILNLNNEFDLHLPYSATNLKSCRKFSNKKINISDFTWLLSNSFLSNEGGHRIYGSAGALYPVEPLIICIKDNMVVGLPQGVYGIDYLNKALKKVNTKVDFKKLSHSISPYTGQLISSIFICYIFSMTRTVVKYNYRGLRHMLIEVGSMTQAFRLNGLARINNFGDVSWSGFDDKALKDSLGLRIMKPVLLQFFGIQDYK